MPRRPACLATFLLVLGLVGCRVTDPCALIAVGATPPAATSDRCVGPAGELLSGTCADDGEWRCVSATFRSDGAFCSQGSGLYSCWVQLDARGRWPA